jgi:two-component system, NtrC family, response regulator AtoC
MNAEAIDRYLALSLLGSSEAMRRVRALIARIARLDIAVLVEGPTGSGKELVASAIHELSARPGCLVAFNVCAIADSMFEDALFGHVRGAYTGAVADTRGYLCEANNGTLFLDEVSGLPLSSQAKLLRAIETGEFRPVGSQGNKRSRFRTIAATNEPIHALVDSGRFRADLAQRLCGIVVCVPALAARREDVPELAEHFAVGVQDGAGPVRLTSGALQLLQQHDWPGNVRELRHVVARAVVLSERRVIAREDIREAIAAGAVRHRDCPLHPSVSLEHSVVRRRLVQVLNAHAWDKARAAAELGIHPVTLYRRMRRLGIPLRGVGTQSSEGGTSACADILSSNGNLVT